MTTQPLANRSGSTRAAYPCRPIRSTRHRKRNAVGIRTGRVQDGTAITWVYDNAYRLINQTKAGQAATLSYDAGGNLLTKHHEGSNPLTMAYDAANRLTTSILGSTQLTTYSYSNAGEMAGERCNYLGVLSTFVYDGEHRCVNELRASGANHTYTYGSDGLRRSAHMAGTANAISFVWDGTDLLNEYVSGALSGRYLTLDGEVLSEKRGANRYVYGVDPLGSVVHLIDSGLVRAGTYTYWPYGEVQSHTGADSPLQFVGGWGYYTATANRVYVRARWLRPDLGRWQTEDPIGFEGGDWNVYGYVQGGPATYHDPSGELRVIVDGACVRPPYSTHDVAGRVRDLCGRLRHSPGCGRRCGDWAHTYRCLMDKCNTTVVVRCLTAAQCRGTCLGGRRRALPCACAFAPSGTVYLCPDALTRGCGCLQDTILHEMAHGCGHSDESCPNCMAGDCTRGLRGCPA